MVLRRRSLLGALLAIFLMAAPTSATSAPGTPVATPEPAVAALLAKSAGAMDGVSTYRFTLAYERGKTTLYGRIHMTKAKGAVARPDRFKATLEAKLGPLAVEVDVVSVGGRVWMSLVGVDKEIRINPDVARVLLDPSAILIGAVRAIEHPQLLGTATIDGTTVTRIGGVVDPKRLEAGASNPVVKQTAALPVELAIDGDGRVLSLRLDGPLIGADSDDVVRRLDLSDFDQPVTIEAPGG